MLAASYWSLLAPAIDMAEESGSFGAFAFFPVALGFALGAAFVYFADLLLPVLVSESLGWGVLGRRFCHGRIQVPIGFSPALMKRCFLQGPAASASAECSFRLSTVFCFLPFFFFHTSAFVLFTGNTLQTVQV